MITRLNSGQLLPAPKKPLPVAINNESVLAAQLQPPPQPEWLADLLRRYAWLPTATLIAAIVVLLLALLLGGALLLVAGVAVSAGLVWLYRRMKEIQRQLAEPQVFKDGAQTPEMVDRAPLSPDFRVSTPDDGFKPQAGSSDSAEAVRGTRNPTGARPGRGVRPRAIASAPSRASPATPAPATASRMKWLPVATIEYTTSAG